MRKSHASLISWLLAGALPVPATTKLDKGEVRFSPLQPYGNVAILDESLKLGANPSVPIGRVSGWMRNLS